jgi:hypothetical protein
MKRNSGKRLRRLRRMSALRKNVPKMSALRKNVPKKSVLGKSLLIKVYNSHKAKSKKVEYKKVFHKHPKNKK